MADGKYHIGFALSGGFIRGIAHLGMLQALFEHNIRPDILSGTSAGAIVSVFIADGRQPPRPARKIVQPQDRELQWRSDVDVHPQLAEDAVFNMFVHRIAEAMARAVRPGAPAR